MIKKCLYCNKEFIPKKSIVKYCSKSCSIKDRHKEDLGLFRKEVQGYIKRYILGLIMTDGCVTKNGESSVIVISLKDKYIIYQIRNLICPTKKVYKDGNNFQVRWRNTKDIKILEKLGIKQKKTLSMPFINIKRFKWDFIRGLFDGDGCVYNSTTYNKKMDKEYYYKYISFTCGSVNFANGLNDFLNKNDINSKIYKEHRSDNVVYVKILNKKDVEKFYKNIYQKDNDIWKLERKYNIF